MPQNLNLVRRCAWVTLLLMGTLQAWVFRHVVSPDGVAYLDLSDAVVHGRLSGLVNGYWSPLYPALVGILRIAVSPTPLAAPYWELALLHVVSFLGFALSLAAFEWFLRSLDAEGADWGDTARPFASPTGLAVAYLLFAVASLGMISVAATAPDFFLSAAMLAAFACLLRLRADVTDRVSAVRLGLALAFGALAKSIAFPLGLVILAGLAIATWRHGGRPAVLRSTAVFALATLPWVAALSIAAERPTLGSTGALNYAWYVNDQQPPNAGVLPALAVPADSPRVAGIAVLSEARGTNPLWYDPARWHRDLRPRFSAQQQWKRLSWSLRYYVFIGAPLLLAAAALGGSAAWRDVALTIRRGSVVLLPCFAGLGAYALVYTTSRHIAVFLLAACLVLAASFPRSADLSRARLGAAFGAALFAIEALAPPPLRSMVTVAYGMALFLVGWVSLENRSATLRWAGALATILLLWALPLFPTPVARSAPLAMGLAMWAALTLVSKSAAMGSQAAAVRRAFAIAAVVACAVPGIGFGIAAVRRWIADAGGDVHPEWTSAQRFMREGIAPGSRIVILGNPENSGWARLARYRIVGIVPDDRVEALFALPDAERARVMRAFSGVGASRLVRAPRR